MEPEDHTVGLLVIVLLLVWCWAPSNPANLTTAQSMCVCQGKPNTPDTRPVASAESDWNARILDADLLGQDATWMPEESAP
jgi:hypothetical protein